MLSENTKPASGSTVRKFYSLFTSSIKNISFRFKVTKIFKPQKYSTSKKEYKENFMITKFGFIKNSIAKILII